MKSKWSFAAMLLVFIIQLYCAFIYYPKWKNSGTEATISWDASGYYMYLPAIFIYHDIKQCGFQQAIIDKYHPSPDFQQAFLHESGNYVMKYSSGQAIMLSPAFFAAHIFCKVTHWYPADGFSPPYQFATALWCIILAFVGLWFLRKILLAFFSDTVVALTIFCIGICTNYLEYSSISGAMSHSNLFTIYALLLYVVYSFYTTPTALKAAIIGLLCGLATITRPTEIISIIIPLLWGLYNRATITDRLKFYSIHYKKILISISVFLIIGMIQPLYWKYVSGNWWVYSYGKQGFDWLHPHFIKCLFHANAGWLRYSPVFIFAIIGFYALYRLYKKLFWVTFIFCGVFTYICFSWSEWWYGWSLGQRAMVQSYPVWAISMAAFFHYILSNYKKPATILLIVTLPFFTWYNAWCIYQSHTGGLLKGPEMNNAYFNAIFGKKIVPASTLLLLDNTEQKEAAFENGNLIYTNSFKNDSSQNHFFDTTAKTNEIFLDKTHQFSDEYFIPIKNKYSQYALTTVVGQNEIEWDNWKMTQIAFSFYNDDKKVKEKIIRLNRVLDGTPNQEVTLFIFAPNEAYNKIGYHFYHAESDKKIELLSIKIKAI